MDTKNIKDEQIRKQIITASEVYRDKLAGRVFLYVYGESYFEVVFPTDRFRHLTGVNSSISAQEFYDKAKSSMLKMFHREYLAGRKTLFEIDQYMECQTAYYRHFDDHGRLLRLRRLHYAMFNRYREQEQLKKSA